mmetsp:Transcript_5794/g.19166  ORF Transcript_5794/g.19166 Transcript_5794/m.19166 type:complete len:203 (+) Transcript_5794:1518-2126(+)
MDVHKVANNCISGSYISIAGPITSPDIHVLIVDASDKTHLPPMLPSLRVRTRYPHTDERAIAPCSEIIPFQHHTHGTGGRRAAALPPHAVSMALRGRSGCATHSRERLPSATSQALAWAMAATISANSGLSEAPPTRKPSTSAQAESSGAFLALAEPPYWMRMPSAHAGLTFSEIHLRMAACVSCAWSGDAVTPVPIDQTGS